jgi:hypothetical protein
VLAEEGKGTDENANWAALGRKNACLSSIAYLSVRTEICAASLALFVVCLYYLPQSFLYINTGLAVLISSLFIARASRCLMASLSCVSSPSPLVLLPTRSAPTSDFHSC